MNDRPRDADVLLLGIDRAVPAFAACRVVTMDEGAGAPCNIRFGLDQSFASVLQNSEGPSAQECQGVHDGLRATR